MATIISRRAFVLVLFLLLSILFLGISYAQESSETSSGTETAGSTKIAQVEAKRQNILENVQKKREAAMERVKTARENFQEKLSQITDEGKKNAVERINNALSTINTNKTDRWASALEKLSDILERIKNKVSDAEANGADVSAINELITTAEGAIASATNAVETQAGKEYVIEITDEETLGQSVRTVVQQFKQDLRTVHAEVIKARDAVRQAARALVSLNTTSNESSGSAPLNNTLQ